MVPLILASWGEVSCCISLPNRHHPVMDRNEPVSLYLSESGLLKLRIMG